jgi:hypothetical protein
MMDLAEAKQRARYQWFAGGQMYEVGGQEETEFERAWDRAVGATGGLKDDLTVIDKTGAHRAFVAGRPLPEVTSREETLFNAIVEVREREAVEGRVELPERKDLDPETRRSMDRYQVWFAGREGRTIDGRDIAAFRNAEMQRDDDERMRREEEQSSRAVAVGRSQAVSATNSDSFSDGVM